MGFGPVGWEAAGGAMGLGAEGEAAQAQGLGQRTRAEELGACVFSCSMQEQGRPAMARRPARGPARVMLLLWTHQREWETCER